jgi:phosphatidylglycerol---prolipoprotein diacylglyceryl transferase
VFPVLAHVGGVPILTHDAFVALGIAVAALVFWWEVRRRGVGDERVWYVVAGAIVGGALLGRLGTWFQHLDLRANASLPEQWLYGNRSILSGLLGAYVGALVAKRLCGYRESTGDLFAPAVAAGMAIGRFGCLLSENPGTPTGGGWGIVLTDAEAAAMPGAVAGTPLHPSFAYEIAFHAAAFVVLWWLRGRVDRPGELFKLYLAGYAVFRFAVEFVRGNEAVVLGLSRPQLFLLACAPLLAWHIARQARQGTYRRVFSRPEEVHA